MIKLFNYHKVYFGICRKTRYIKTKKLHSNDNSRKVIFKSSSNASSYLWPSHLIKYFRFQFFRDIIHIFMYRLFILVFFFLYIYR